MIRLGRLNDVFFHELGGLEQLVAQSAPVLVLIDLDRPLTGILVDEPKQ